MKPTLHQTHRKISNSDMQIHLPETTELSAFVKCLLILTSLFFVVALLTATAFIAMENGNNTTIPIAPTGESPTKTPKRLFKIKVEVPENEMVFDTNSLDQFYGHFNSILIKLQFQSCRTNDIPNKVVGLQNLPDTLINVTIHSNCQFITGINIPRETVSNRTEKSFWIRKIYVFQYNIVKNKQS